MSATATDPEVLVLSGSWHKTKSELSFVTRVVAGAASRTGIVNVVTPIPADATEADGAFDVRGIGQSPDGDWPTAGAARWTRRPSLGATWILDEPTDLPDGTEVELVAVDELDETQRAELEAALEESEAELDAGRGVGEDALWARLRALR